MKKIMKSLLVLSSIIFFTGCATVIKGTNQDITFDSSPRGASIFLDGIRVGTTPVLLTLKKNKYKSFRIEKEGYHSISRNMSTDYDLVTLFSIFWDYSTTDLLTGAAFQYSENAYFIELQEK